MEVCQKDYDYVISIDISIYKRSGKKFNVFLSGDYEFLSNMCGISGASGNCITHIKLYIIMLHNYNTIGKHFCIWCEISKEAIRSDGSFPERSLETLERDHQNFLQSGGNPKNVKYHNNALKKPFFNIPLSQVKLKLCIYLNIIIIVGLCARVARLTGNLSSPFHVT